MPQSDLSVKVQGQTKIYWQMDKRTATDRDTHNIFTDFTERYKVAQKARVIDESRRHNCIQKHGY